MGRLDREFERIFVIGASVRFACGSLRRAGWKCAGADLFGDLETRLAGPSLQSADYPEGLLRSLSSHRRDNAGSSSWMYTGGLENFGARFPLAPSWMQLLGNAADCLAAVRNPFTLRNQLRRRDIKMPEISSSVPSKLEADWLFKPFASCGGLQVRMVSDGPVSEPLAKDGYYQRYVPGRVYGATFVAAQGRCQLIGVTRAIGQPDWTGASRFQYAGSTGPIRLTRGEQQRIKSVGQAVASAFPLVGVFGIDLIRTPSDGFLVIEVNPRIPSSSELLERSTGQSIAELHVLSCRFGQLPGGSAPPDLPSLNKSAVYGKAIVYAPQAVVSTAGLRDEAAVDLEQASAHWLSDTPADDKPIPAGLPIATVFASADDETGVLAELQRLASRVVALCR